MALNKEAVCNVGAEGDVDPIPGWERSAGGGHRNPLQNSCQENSMHRGACGLQSLGSGRVRHD